MNKLKNKKGQGWGVLIVVGIILLALFLISGALSLAGVIKIISGLKSIPTWAWIAIAVVLFLIIIPKGKK